MEYDFNNQETIQGFNNELNSIISENNGGRAFKFFYFMERILAQPLIKDKLSGESLKQYQQMIIKAKFIALYRLKEKEIYELLTNHFNYCFAIEGYNLYKKIKDYLTTLSSLIARNNFKNGLRKILSNSQALVASGKIILDGKTAEPTISNWLKDFRLRFGEESFSDSLKVSDYLANSQNTKSLSAEERQKISNLLDWYGKLKISSLNISGLEEDITIIKPDGGVAFIKQGRLENINKEAKDVYQKISGVLDITEKKKEFQQLAAQYPAGSLERKAVEEEIKKLEL
ncbi:hypothetical protein GW901_00635 [Candidatus Parcubacteria bacterium]|nr:hypothetical protein [Candidatus Parcubacteria bacterium]